MRRALPLVLLALVVAACSRKYRAEDEDQDQDQATGETVEEQIADAIKYLDQKHFSTVSAMIFNAGHTRDGAVRPDAAQRVARVQAALAPRLLAYWDALAEHEKQGAKKVGVERARGSSEKTCFGCLRELIEAVAHTSPELQARWKALAAELAEIEAAAHAEEARDTRPRVYLEARGDLDDMALPCALEALAERHPGYKWLSGRPRDGASSLRITSQTAGAEYRNQQREVATTLMTGLRVTIAGERLDPALARELRLPIVAEAEVESPETISGLGGATVESTRIGMAQIQLLTADVCSKLSRRIRGK